MQLCRELHVTLTSPGAISLTHAHFDQSAEIALSHTEMCQRLSHTCQQLRELAFGFFDAPLVATCQNLGMCRAVT